MSPVPRGVITTPLFPPFADTSAVVAAKRVREQGKLGDVVTIAMDRVRRKDESLTRIAGPLIGSKIVLSIAPPRLWLGSDERYYFASWHAIERFALDGMEAILKQESLQGTYQWVYSRAQFAASHFLAAMYKITNPAAHWRAEFSDPLSRDIASNERGAPIRKGRLSAGLVAGLQAQQLPLPRSQNRFVWSEEIAYVLADELVFTNSNQLEYMLDYCSNPAAADLARAKATVAPHPTLPHEFYSMKDADYNLDPQIVNLGYFGTFYSNRGISDVLSAIGNSSRKIRTNLCLHVFTGKGAELSAQAERVGVRDCLRINPPLDYLKFLNLTTKLDCLIVNDAVTAATHKINPYLPSKLSDYRGSGRAVWGLVEHGSPLSSQQLDFASPVGDIGAMCEVLAQLVAHRQRAGQPLPQKQA